MKEHERRKIIREWMTLPKDKRRTAQYSIQGLNCDDSDLKDLLMDIGTEELSHLEVIGTRENVQRQKDEQPARLWRWDRQRA
jgi:Manganese containing catalase